MASVQRVSCRSMRADAEALSKALERIPKNIELLQGSLRNLMRCWDGPAWAAFQTQVNTDIQNMQEVYQKLVKIQKALGKGREEYLQTEYDVYVDVKRLWI